ncbi:MAG: copper transporter [Trebonia sp.]
MIDFRYHLVSIVAVFLALAIGIVLGSTALQGSTIDVLRHTSDSLQNQLNAASAQRDSFEQAADADSEFLQTAEPKLLSGMLPDTKMLLVTEPGAPSSVISGIQSAAKYAGATITGTIALQPKFNDLSGATRADLSEINSRLAAPSGVVLTPATTDPKTAYQQEAAQLIADAALERSANEPSLALADPQALLKAYTDGGYLTYTGTPAARATLAVVITAPASASDGPGNPADEVLLALAGQFASFSAATLVAGPVMGSSLSNSPVSVLRNSSVSSQVSTVDNADKRVGQVAAVWALADQLQGAKPRSYGVSGASAVSPVPSAVPSTTPAATVTTPASKTGKGKVKKT